LASKLSPVLRFYPFSSRIDENYLVTMLNLYDVVCLYVSPGLIMVLGKLSLKDKSNEKFNIFFSYNLNIYYIY
jgi:hypothetical protein